MARRHPPRLGEPKALRIRTESGPDGQWNVSDVSGANATKDYRCPGCQQVIAAGTAHLVAWSADGFGGLDERRHWHRPCWQARYRRR